MRDQPGRDVLVTNVTESAPLISSEEDVSEAYRKLKPGTQGYKTGVRLRVGEYSSMEPLVAGTYYSEKEDDYRWVADGNACN